MKKSTFFVLLLSLSIPLAFSRQDETLTRDRQTDPSSQKEENLQRKAAVGTPTRAIQDLEKRGDDYNTSPQLTAEQRAHNTRIKREIINGTFNIRELCRLALDKHWDKIAVSEQNRFVDVMTQLLEKQGILSKEQSKTRNQAYTIQYVGEHFLNGDSNRAEVKTKVYIKKQNIHMSIDYRLVRAKDSWRIFDVIVDDASLMENYRYQFDSIITKHGYQDLVGRIEKKLKDMKLE